MTTKVSYLDFKKNRESYADALAAELENETKPVMKYEDADERFWFPTIDDSGYSRALIRFLPSQYHLNKPWARYWTYNFQGPTGLVYNEKSLVTIGQSDPVAQFNSQEWATNKKSKQDEVRARRRGVRYISNVYIIKDPAKPENDGKVKLFRYGAQIQGLIEKVMPFKKKDDKEEKKKEILSEAELDDMVKFIPFDLLEGANFLLKVRPKDDDKPSQNGQKKKSFPTYVDSKFERPSPFLGGDDERVSKIFEQTYDLSEFTDPSTFKSHDELKARMIKVLGLDGNISAAADVVSPDDSDDIPDVNLDSDEDKKLKELFAKINAE